MTGVNTAMPSKLGSLTVLSSMRPPKLEREAQRVSIQSLLNLTMCTCKSNQLLSVFDTCWWTWLWSRAATLTAEPPWSEGSAAPPWPREGSKPRRPDTPVGTGTRYLSDRELGDDKNMRNHTKLTCPHIFFMWVHGFVLSDAERRWDVPTLEYRINNWVPTFK